jgi:hypothetical protein
MNFTFGCFFSILAMESVGSGKGNMHKMRSSSGNEASPMIVDVMADKRFAAVPNMHFLLMALIGAMRRRRALEIY